MGLFLVFWEMSVSFGWVNPLFTSSPSRIVTTAIEMFADGSIWYDLAVSGHEFIVGYGMAIVIGVPLGILMGWYGRVDAVLDPFVTALYATPRIALLAAGDDLVRHRHRVEDRDRVPRRHLSDSGQHHHRRAHHERGFHQGGALVRQQRPAIVPDRGAAIRRCRCC